MDKLSYTVDFGDGRPRKVYDHFNRLNNLAQINPEIHSVVLVQDEDVIVPYIVEKSYEVTATGAILEYYWDIDKTEPDFVILPTRCGEL